MHRTFALLTAAALAAIAQDVDAQPFPGRAAHAAAYDSVHGVTYVFGGVSQREGATYPSSLWAWDGAEWKQLSSDGPPGREDAGLAYDAARDRLVMYGGRVRDERGMRSLSDTWEWDGSRWTRMDTIGAGSLTHASVVYDAAQKRVVLFGGGDDNDRLNTRLWSWDGHQWSSRATSIGDASRVNGVLYSRADNLLLALTFAPQHAQATPGGLWQLHDSVWTRVGDTPGYSPIAPAALMQSTGRVVIFAPFDEGRSGSITWIRRGGTWEESRSPGPSRRRGPAMVYDTRRDVVVLIGGDDGNDAILDDVWEFDGVRWMKR